ncbi:MAG: hypothetical protein FWH35_08965, partial [Treponema sp.]|nr:hypothetical protein [Treponema sp.]
VMGKNLSFINMMKSMISCLEELSKKSGANNAKTLAAFPDPALLSRLLAAANKYNASEMDSLIRELESFDYESGRDLVIWLRERMINLDYDAICERLNEELKELAEA